MDIIIGSDEENAITKALDVNFPAASRFLCAKHLKDGTNAYMQKTVGIPQKERSEISRSIFGESGLVSANSSFTFDNKTGVVMSKISKYPKFVEYFRKNLEPAIRNNVNTPMRNATFSKLWTNNNCESINHIMKLDAGWKHQKTPKLMTMLHEITHCTLKIYVDLFMAAEIIDFQRSLNAITLVQKTGTFSRKIKRKPYLSTF